MMTAIYAIILFMILVIPHELGHLLAAKWAGVRVNEFAVGMGPTILNKQKGETKYSIRLLPLGGFCAMEGENGDSEDDRSFMRKSAPKKIIILSAGVITNMILAVIILSVSAMISGVPTSTIGEVSANTPAAEVGLQSGDEIISINGEDISQWSEVSSAIMLDIENTNITVLRDENTLSYTTTPIENEQGGYIIGVTSQLSHNPFSAVYYGTVETVELCKAIFASFAMIFSGEVGSEDIAGPIGIIQLAGDTAELGLSYFFFLAAFMSINLAIINFLPFPALDGGRILMVILRKVTGTAISDKVEGIVHATGMIVLLLLVVFVTWNDITRLFS